MTGAGSLRGRRAVARFDRPGAFQSTILGALELPKDQREVFLPQDTQGHTLMEIPAILGISIATARVRLKRARREIGHLGDSEATRHAR
jgi:DNA-directed RNA polymerase specialized sigma24 family protein